MEGEISALVWLKSYNAYQRGLVKVLDRDRALCRRLRSWSTIGADVLSVRNVSSSHRVAWDEWP